jgi:hypothetical protein
MGGESRSIEKPDKRRVLLSLNEVPLDAPYVGAGPLFEWDAEAAAWVSYCGARLVMPKAGDSLSESRELS